jgi:hypothetical protein
MSAVFLRNFTAKRLHSIAQGFNPGFVDIKRALKVAPDLGAGVSVITPSAERTTSGATFRAHLWALLPRVKTLGAKFFNRFAVSPTASLRAEEYPDE